MNRKKLYISIVAFAVVLAAIIIVFIIHKKGYDSDLSQNADNKASIFGSYEFSKDFDDTSWMYITESADSFFLLTDFISYQNIYKISKQTGAAEILCSNPQCTHTDNTCSAYLGYPEDGTWLNFYNNRLYYMSKIDIEDELRSEEWIMSMDLTGKDRKKEVKINDVIDSSENGWAIHMDTYGREIYLSKMYTEVDEDGISRSKRAEIYIINLDTNEMIKIYDKEQIGINVYAGSKKDNIVYIEVSCYDDNAEIQYTASLLTYDESNGNMTEEEIGSYYFRGISGGNKYFSTPYESENRILVKKSGLEEYEEIYNMGKENVASVEVSDKYILIYKANESIMIFDTEGNFIKEINVDGASYFDTRVSNGFIFLQKKNENEQYDIYLCPIATDTNTWTKIN